MPTPLKEAQLCEDKLAQAFRMTNRSINKLVKKVKEADINHMLPIIWNSSLTNIWEQQTTGNNEPNEEFSYKLACGILKNDKNFQELSRRLDKKGVAIVPGRGFFFCFPNDM